MLKLIHLVDESFALLADKIFCRDFHVVKKQLGRIAAVASHFFLFSADLKPGQICGNDEQAE